MRKEFLKTFLGILFTVLVSSCTKPPELPRLPQREPLAVEQIVLRDKIGPDDIRHIFRAVNSSGRLNLLKPYFEDASDDALKLAGDLLTRYVYREHRLTDLIETRIDERGFSTFDNWVKRWSAAATFKDERSLVQAIFQSDMASSLFERDIELLGPSFLGELNLARARSKSRFLSEKIEEEKEVPLPTGAEIITDAERFIGDANLVGLFTETANRLDSNYAGIAVMRALAKIQDNDERIEPSKYFEGLGHGLRKMLETKSMGDAASTEYKNQLDLLLHFAAVANHDSRSLFRGVEERLAANSGLLNIYAGQLQAVVRSAIAGWIEVRLHEAKLDDSFWKDLAEGPDGLSPQFDTLFDIVLGAVGKVTPLRPPQQAGGFENNRPIYLNAFALTRWIEKTAKLNGGAPIVTMAENIKVAAVPVPFAQLSGQEVKFPLDAQLNRKKHQPFYGAFQRYVTSRAESLSIFSYRLTNFTLEMPFSKALLVAVTDCENSQPFTRAVVFLQSFAYAATHPSPGSAFRISTLGSVDLMDSLNRLISFTPLEIFRSIKTGLFEGLKLGNLSAEDRKVFTDLLPERGYEGERRLFDELLISFQSIQAMDTPASKGLPSAFEIYYRILGYTSDNDIPWVSSLLTFLSQARFFGESGNDSAPHYPSLYRGLQRTALSRTLHTLSLVDESKRAAFLGAMERAFGLRRRSESGTRQHIDFFERLLRTQRSGLVSIAERLLNQSLTTEKVEELLHGSEFDWLRVFIDQGDFAVLWRLIQENGSTKALHDFAKTARELCQSGEIEKPLQLLGYLKDSRVQELSRMLLKMYQTGELEKLLHALEFVLDTGAN
jgi:hypothetical protein